MWSELLARQAYSLLLRVGMPLYLARVWSRGRVEPSYRHAWWERLGVYGPAYRRAWTHAGQTPRPPVLWLHAVSLGETRAVAPLVHALRQLQPHMRLLLTHTTATGREAGASLLQAGDVQTWFPYDTPGAVARFLRFHQPSVGVLMETEVWPNVQHAAQHWGVPMVLVNGRLSEKSLRQGRRLALLMRPAARALRVVLAQTKADAQRFSAMGAPHVKVCGLLKFDMTPSGTLLERGQRWRAASVRPIVLAASTREGEEAGLLAAWRVALASVPDPADAPDMRPRLWIVPRHPQRFDEVAQAIAQQGFSCARRSLWQDDMPGADAMEADVWLGDSMGEMPAYYAAAQVALLGGSFAPLGGQNLIEAAACGCPVVMGPSTFNFADAAKMCVEAGAGVRVADWAEGVAQALAWCRPQVQEPVSQAALAFAAAHRGAAAVMAQEVWQVAAR